MVGSDVDADSSEQSDDYDEEEELLLVVGDEGEGVAAEGGLAEVDEGHDEQEEVGDEEVEKGLVQFGWCGLVQF